MRKTTYRSNFFILGGKALGISEFPGDFKQMPELKKVQLTLRTNFSELISTGYYLPADTQLKIEVTYGDWKKWTVQIGSHSDDISNCNEYRRWPNIIIKKSLVDKKMNLSSPYGGLVYFETTHPETIKITLANVVESPFIDLTQPETIEDWKRRRHAVGLWYFLFF